MKTAEETFALIQEAAKAVADMYDFTEYNTDSKDDRADEVTKMLMEGKDENGIPYYLAYLVLNVLTCYGAEVVLGKKDSMLIDVLDVVSFTAKRASDQRMNEPDDKV